MQIKFNKLVKPVVPLSESEVSQPAAEAIKPVPEANKPAVQPAIKPSAIDEALSSQAPKKPAFQMDELPKKLVEEAPAPAPVPAPVPAPAPIAEEVPAPAEEAAVHVASAGSTEKLEDTMKKFLGKQIRIYMSDHEYVAGKLEIVADGWVKICTGRSAGSDYYIDEDIINLSNIVRVRATVTIDKKQYVDFMNSIN